MRDRLGAVVIAAFTLSTAVLVGAPAPVAAAAPKVAIIVGPTEITDSHYQPWAEDLADTARAAGATVDLRYCPTPAEAKTAASGASIIVYFGHGNGFPNPYSSTENPLSVNGWGLRDPAKSWGGTTCGNSVLRYYGESYLTGAVSGYGWTGGGITPAANFVMVYSNACYAPGAGESRPAAAESVAVARVANYSTPALRLGGTYFATDLGSDRLVDLILRNPNQDFGSIFRMGNGFDAAALRSRAHPDVAGSQVWVQKTSNQWLGTDYWYAFAGNPNRTPNGGTSGPSMTRLAGSDRYATAAAISRESFDPGVPVAYVATGASFPDALTAGAAAARHDGPVLLVTAGSVPAATATELARLRPATIKVVGGPSMIRDGVLQQLGEFATNGQVVRVAGANRYATAASVSIDTFDPDVPIAYVATGEMFPDALAGVAAAGATGGPILLVRIDEIPGETVSELSRLRPGRIVVLGGGGVVSDGVVASLQGFATSGEVTRLAGADRYATAVAVTSGTFASGATVYVATGLSFPDALGGGPVAGGLPGPLLLVPGTSVPPSVATELSRLDPQTVVLLGGPSSISDTVAWQIANLLAD